jgi:hypothetical protein
MRMALQDLPVTGPHTIGDFRPTTIGGLRPRLIGSTRQASPHKIFRQGFMLVPGQTGLLVGKKQTPLSPYFPPAQDYDSAPLYHERTFMFRPTGGMGESVQSSATDHRYHYAIDCWVTGGLIGKGPLVHPIVPAASGLVRRFNEALNASGSLALFYLAGANVFVRGDDTNGGQTAVITRAGQTATDAQRFKGAYAGAVDALYVAWGDGVLQEYASGATATCALPAGFKANLLEIVGDELWAADTAACMIRKCTNDPKVAGSWSGPIQIGNPSIAITALRQTTNRLCIFKANGDVFTINGDGSDNDLFPGLQSTVDPDNARTAAAWQGSLWFRTGRAFWRLDMQGGATLSPEGPGRALSNLSDVKGPVQAFAGWNSQMAFGAVYNAANTTSYLLTYGNWEPSSGDSGTSYTFANQWDGAIAHWPGRRATALWVSNIPSDARLYVGFADGGYDWIKLVPFPLTPDSGAEYTLGPSYIVTPLNHLMFQADNKQLIGASVFGPSFPQSATVQLAYRLRGSAGMPPSTPATSDFIAWDNPFTFNGQRLDLGQSIASTAVEIKVSLDSADTATSPILEGVGLHERLVPAFKRDFTFTVDARDYVARYDGASVRQSGRSLRDTLLQAAAAPATIALEFPDETVQNVALFDYTEHMLPHVGQGGVAGQGWGVEIQATQFGVIETLGVIGRTRGTHIGDLRGYQIKQTRFL